MSTTLHIAPTDSGEWSVKGDESRDPVIGTSFSCPTQALAIARAVELVQEHEEARVIVFTSDGRVLTSMLIHHYPDALLDDADDPIGRAEALRKMPSFERIKAGVGKYPVEGADFDADPSELY